MTKARLAVTLVFLFLGHSLVAAPPESLTAASLWEAWPSVRVSPPDPGRSSGPSSSRARDARTRQRRPLHGRGRGALGRGAEAHGPRARDRRGACPPLVADARRRAVGDERPARRPLLPRKEPGERGREAAPRGSHDLPSADAQSGRGRADDPRNAQGIDINRDALRLQTPEGRYLKKVRDRFEPAVGFNLHNQSPLTRAGKERGSGALAFLSVAFDEALTENEGRRTTKRLAVFLRGDLSPWAAGKIARYDADYTERAFGDAMTRWGTATLLIETGGWNGPDEAGTLVRLNFVALLRSLQALADGSLDALDPKTYDEIPVLEREGLFDVVIRGGERGERQRPSPVPRRCGAPPPASLRRDGGTRPSRRRRSRDLSTCRGKEEIPAKGRFLVPAPAGGEEGWRKTLARSAKEARRRRRRPPALTRAALARGESLDAGATTSRPRVRRCSPDLVPAADGALRLDRGSRAWRPKRKPPRRPDVARAPHGRRGRRRRDYSRRRDAAFGRRTAAVTHGTSSSRASARRVRSGSRRPGPLCRCRRPRVAALRCTSRRRASETLGLVDLDSVDESNLQRQVLYGTKDVGRSKVEAGGRAARRPESKRPDREARGAADVVERDGDLSVYDVVPARRDNFPSRYVINAACVA